MIPEMCDGGVDLPLVAQELRAPASGTSKTWAGSAPVPRGPRSERAVTSP